MEITFSEIADKNNWESFVKERSEANFLQSWYWGEFHHALGHKIHRQGVYNNGVLVGVMLLITEDARRGRYMVVPAGPLIDWTDNALVSAVVRNIRDMAKREKVVFVRVRPQLSDISENQILFKKLGFIFAPTHLHAELTSELSLAPSLNDILKDMRKQTRYEIKKAEKLGIEVEETTDAEKIKPFYDLQLETAKRQGFVPFSYQFLHEQFKIFADAGCAKLYTAMYEGKILAQAFIIFYGHEAAYHYGASTNEGRNFPGAYAIQWKAIQDAKASGLRTYNFWGVAPIENKKHRFYPISIFKRGFGGRDVAYLHARDLVIDYPRYLVAFAVEYARKLRRRT
jgi:lipid II:glycine glycyltransferase (peptidoglycan interpeptide bridge formation enzyme)